MDTKFINGLRVTDAETMELAEMVLAKVNKELGDKGAVPRRQGSGYQRHRTEVF